MRTRFQQAGLILLVEDQPLVAQMIGAALEKKGFAIDYAADGPSGLHLAVYGSYDAILLDVTLPVLDGIEVCRQLRQLQKSIPVLMISGRATLEEKITGLEAGADDYLVKPFEIRELDARLRALIRRDRRQMVTGILVVADLTLDTSTNRVERAGKRLCLSPMGLQLLNILMRESPKYVSRQDIEREIWGDMVPNSDTLRSHIYTLRNAIDKPFALPLLHTIPNRGLGLLSLESTAALRSSRVSPTSPDHAAARESVIAD